MCVLRNEHLYISHISILLTKNNVYIESTGLLT